MSLQLFLFVSQRRVANFFATLGFLQRGTCAAVTTAPESFRCIASSAACCYVSHVTKAGNNDHRTLHHNQIIQEIISDGCSNMKRFRPHLTIAGTGCPLPNSRSPIEEVYPDHHPGTLERSVWVSRTFHFNPSPHGRCFQQHSPFPHQRRPWLDQAEPP